MSKPTRPWTVTPHQPLERIDENLWALSSTVPGMGIHRRMIIVRRSDGNLLFFNAVPMNEPTQAEIESFGRPAYLIVPHDQHAIDAHAFRERFGLRAYAPRACEAKVHERVDLVGTLEDVPPDDAMRLETLPFVKRGEPVMWVRSGGGARVSLVTSDVFQNNGPHVPFVFRLLGFNKPNTPLLFRTLFLADRAALKMAYQRWAETKGLVRVVPSHGPVVEADPAGVLRRAGAML